MLVTSAASSLASSISSEFDLDIVTHTPATSVSSSPVCLTPSPVLPPHTDRGAQSPAVWFDDGNVILRTLDHPTQSPTLYKAYTGVLSLQSSVLRDRIRLATADADEYDETYEKCTIIDLDDPTDEMTPFLEALHDLNAPPANLTSLGAVESFIRLGTKYKAERLLQCAISTLELEFPSTLAAYDQHMHDSTNGARGLELAPGQHFHLLNLAREYNLSSILPSLLYVCATRYSIAQLCNGCRCSPNDASEQDLSLSSTSSSSSDDSTIQHHTMRTATHCKINSTTDIQICLAVQNRLPIMTHKLISFLREQPPGGNPHHDYRGQRTYECPDRVRCTLARYRWLVDLPPTVTDPLGFSIDWRAYGEAVCSECVGYAKARFECERTRMWEALPGIFGLQPWGHGGREEVISVACPAAAAAAAAVVVVEECGSEE